MDVEQRVDLLEVWDLAVLQPMNRIGPTNTFPSLLVFFRKATAVLTERGS